MFPLSLAYVINFNDMEILSRGNSMDRLAKFTVRQLVELVNIPTKCRLGEDIIIFESDEIIKKYEHLLFSPSRLDAIMIFFCTQGSMRLRINLKEYDITEGMMVVNLPQNIVQVISSDNFKAKGLIIAVEYMKSINVEPKMLMPLYKHFQFHTINNPTPGELASIDKYGELLSDSVSSRDSIYKANIVKGLISAICYKIIDIVQSGVDNDSEPGGVRDRRAAVYEQFMRLLIEYHCHDRSVGFYAAKLGLTPKYFSKIIDEFSGKSAAEWIDEYVILEAKTLLRYTRMPMSKIASHLNFSNQSFFGRYFKHHTGITPGDYRKKGG